MSDLLDAVFADEAARLVYADALCDRGDVHGELIQVQCALERTPDAALEARERALLDKHRDRWLGPWTKAAQLWRYRRGFLHALAIDGPSFMTGLFGGAHPELRGLRTLELVPTRDPEDDLIVASQLAYVLQAPELSGLEQLRIVSYPLYADTIATLAASERLQTLRLDNNQLGTGGVRQLLAGTWPRLQRLRLRSQDTDDGAAYALATSQLLAQLVELDLSSFDLADRHCNRITDAGARAIVTSPHLANLRRLSLSELGVEDETVAALAGAHPPALADLDLGCTWITQAALGALGTSPLSKQLVRLDLAWTAIDAVDPLFDWPNLRWLGINGAQLPFDALERLATAPHGITHLVLFPDRVPADIAKALRKRFGERWLPHAPATAG